MPSKFHTWLRQPTTMLGLAMVILEVLLAAFGYIPAGAMLCVLGPAFALIGIDDNSALALDLNTLATDSVTAAVQQNLTDNLPKLVKDAIAALTDATVKTSALILAIFVTLALAACTEPVSTTSATPTPSTAGTANVALACQVDQTEQPISAALLETLAPGATATTGILIDELLVHPAVVSYCQGLGGVPVPVCTSAVPASTVTGPATIAATAPACPAAPGAMRAPPTSLAPRSWLMRWNNASVWLRLRDDTALVSVAFAF